MSTQSTNDVIQQAILLQKFEFFSNAHSILSVGTVKHVPTQVNDFIRAPVQFLPREAAMLASAVLGIVILSVPNKGMLKNSATICLCVTNFR